MDSQRLRMRNTMQCPSAQSGAVLVVALILLLVLTFIGVSTMESTGMEMKMANQNRERLIAMQAAEAGLREAETYIEDVGFSEDELTGSSCTGANQRCFKADCSDGGYCFNGTNADDPLNCALDPLSTPVWENATLNVWKTAGRHQALPEGNLEARVQYVVEFLCFIPNTTSGSLAAGDGVPLFRITSLATTRTGKSRVMLQSTYKGDAL